MQLHPTKCGLKLGVFVNGTYEGCFRGEVRTCENSSPREIILSFCIFVDVESGTSV